MNMVKFSEQLPPLGKPVIIRNAGFASMGTLSKKEDDYYITWDEDNGGAWLHKLKDAEWLDESVTTAQQLQKDIVLKKMAVTLESLNATLQGPINVLTSRRLREIIDDVLIEYKAIKQKEGDTK
jgi:hypothetical protein